MKRIEIYRRIYRNIISSKFKLYCRLNIEKHFYIEIFPTNFKLFSSWFYWINHDDLNSLNRQYTNEYLNIETFLLTYYVYRFGKLAWIHTIMWNKIPNRIPKMQIMGARTSVPKTSESTEAGAQGVLCCGMFLGWSQSGGSKVYQKIRIIFRKTNVSSCILEKLGYMCYSTRWIVKKGECLNI